MTYKTLIAGTIAITVCAFTGSNVMAHGGGGGGGHGGGGFGGGGGFHGGGFGGVFAVVLTLLAFAADFVVMAFAAAAFMMVAFAAVDSTIAASTMGSSSVVLGTRSFTIPIHTTGTIPTAIILTVTDTVHTIRTINLLTKAALDIPTL